MTLEPNGINRRDELNMLAYHILLCCSLNVTVINLCIHFLLAPVEGLSYKLKYRANIFHSLFHILILFLTLPLAVRISLLFISLSQFELLYLVR